MFSKVLLHFTGWRPRLILKFDLCNSHGVIALTHHTAIELNLLIIVASHAILTNVSSSISLTLLFRLEIVDIKITQQGSVLHFLTKICEDRFTSRQVNSNALEDIMHELILVSLSCCVHEIGTLHVE